MSKKEEYVAIELPNGVFARVEVNQTGIEDVSFKTFPLKDISKTIEGIAEVMVSSLDKIAPDKAMIKFGLEISIESNALSAIIVKGSGKGNLEITLEWTKQK